MKDHRRGSTVRTQVKSSVPIFLVVEGFPNIDGNAEGDDAGGIRSVGGRLLAGGRLVDDSPEATISLEVGRI